MPAAAALLVSTGGGFADGAGDTVIVSVACALPPAFVATIGTAKVPEVVGVPEIDPLDVLTLSPAGKFVAL